VRGRDLAGHRFAESTILEDVSASGLFVKLHSDVPLSGRVFIVFTFKTVESQQTAAPRVASLGEVRRIEKTDGGPQRGIGIEFRNYRFL